MATAKQKMKVLYHSYFCGDDIGEADGFFEIVNGKLELVDSWSLNDAHWRGEYMSGILAWAGVRTEKLPEKHMAAAEKLIAKCWGLDSEDESEDEEGEPEVSTLYYQEGTSDKIYIVHLALDGGYWSVTADYGRRGGKRKREVKDTGLNYEDAKILFDRTVESKLKKGYKHSLQPDNDEEDEDY